MIIEENKAMWKMLMKSVDANIFITIQVQPIECVVENLLYEKYLVQMFTPQIISISQERKALLDLSGVALTVNSIWNFVVGLIKGGKSTRAMLRAENSMENALDYAALIFKGSAVVRESLEVTFADVVGFKSKARAFILGTFGLALAVIGSFTHLKPLSILAIGIGTVGLGISFYNLIHHKISNTEKLVKILILILGAVGIGLAITSLIV